MHEIQEVKWKLILNSSWHWDRDMDNTSCFQTPCCKYSHSNIQVSHTGVTLSRYCRLDNHPFSFLILDTFLIVKKFLLSWFRARCNIKELAHSSGDADETERYNINQWICLIYKSTGINLVCWSRAPPSLTWLARLW